MINLILRCILFDIDDIKYHYIIRNGVFTKYETQQCAEVHHGLKTTSEHFKDLLVNKVSALTNYVAGNFQIIGSTTDLLKVLSLFK